MFTPAHVHLLLNHFPIILLAVGVFFILVAVIRMREDFARLSLGFFVAVALFAVPTYLTGEGAEDAVEHLPGVTRAIIHEHEAAAFFGLLWGGLLGLYAVWVLWRYRRPKVLPRWVFYVTLVGSLFTMSVLARVGFLGGQVRHTEVR